MRFMQIESVLQTINRSEPAKNRFSVALYVHVCELYSAVKPGFEGRDLIVSVPDHCLSFYWMVSAIRSCIL